MKSNFALLLDNLRQEERMKDASVKVSFPWITVDLTRRCNMKCAHCLRGKAEKDNLDLEKADQFFSQIAWTPLLHLTGGEPTLAIKELEGLVRILEKYQVVFNSVCIGTNAKIVPDAFLDVLKDLYLLSIPSDKANRIFISIDPYHAPIPQGNLDKIHRMKKYQWQVDIARKEPEDIYNLGRGKEIAKKKMDRSNNAMLGGMNKFTPGLFDTYSISDEDLHHTSCQLAEFPIELSVDGKLYPLADMSWEELGGPETSYLPLNIKHFILLPIKPFGHCWDQGGLEDHFVGIHKISELGVKVINR